MINEKLDQRAKIYNRYLYPLKFTRWCTPGMGVNLWGESPLYVKSVNGNSLSTLTKLLAEGKSKIPSFFRGAFP